MKEITYSERRSTFGGRIYESDFDTSHPVGNIVDRIISDERFDEQCYKNCIGRDKKEGKDV